MPTEAQNRITINLIPRKKLSFSERFLSWLLTIGRYIIIGTELIVFVVFISRFQLDAKLSDLNDKIKQEEAIVKSLESIDKEARSLQIRLSEIKRLINLQEKESPSDLLSLIASLAPETISLNTIALREGTLTINAVSNASKGFSVFVQNLRASTLLRNVSIANIEKDETTGGIKFSITAQLVKSIQETQ